MTCEGVTIPGDHVARDGVTALPPATKSPTLYGGRSMPHRGDFMEGAGNQEQGDFRELQLGGHLGAPDSLRRWKQPFTHLIKEKPKTFKLDKLT